MDNRDLKASLIIGAGVGLLVQPILVNVLSSAALSGVERFGVFIFFAAFAPFALWICSLIARVLKGFYQFAKFAAVGTLNSVLDVGIFNLETFLYGSSIIGTALFAVFKAVSFLCATTNSYAWNKYWTFSAQQKPGAGEVTSFYIVAAVGWGLNIGLATLVKALGPADSKTWVDLVAPVSGIAVSFLWNFFGYKYFVFKTRPVAQAA